MWRHIFAKKSNVREFDDFYEQMIPESIMTAAPRQHWLSGAHWQASIIGMLQQPVISITIDATAELTTHMLTISGIRDAEAKALAAELDLIELA